MQSCDVSCRCRFQTFGISRSTTKILSAVHVTTARSSAGIVDSMHHETLGQLDGFAFMACWSHSLCQPQAMLEEIEGLISHLARGCPPKQTLWTRNRGESWMCFHCARHFRYARETSHAHGLEISDAASQSNHMQHNLESNPVLHSATRIVERSCLRFKPNPVKSSNSGGLLPTQAQLNFCSPRIRYEQVCTQAPCRAALFVL